MELTGLYLHKEKKMITVVGLGKTSYPINISHPLKIKWLAP